MIDHVNLPVSDLKTSKPFYDAILATLGMGALVVEDDVIGYGQNYWAFGIVQTSGLIPPMHLAFNANSRDQVVAFYDTALAMGATSNGAPDLRAAYGPSYFAAYVLDPDGHNIEAVLRG